ncbi:hypothetical protein [Egicoccus sp. AB-alg2]|uniref:hypothetical protein n=1 Tax=Egicoccus sp. AB-alg2 TaxID=3242693 RepID=UPI00359ED14C
MRTRRAVLAVATVLALSCTGGGEAATTTPAASIPDGWEEHTFEGGAVAAPPDWSEVAPIDTDDLTLQGPDPGDGLPPIARLQVTERDGTPFDQLLQLVSAQLNLQFPDVEPGESRSVELPGADQAQVGTFRYETQADGQPVTLEERFVVAWYGDDGQAQMRIGGPAEHLTEEEPTIEQIIQTLRFDGD